MESVLILIHMLQASRDHGLSISSTARRRAPIRRRDKTTRQDDANTSPLQEDEVYPAFPEDPYGWERLFSERMRRHCQENYGLEPRVARYHNVDGPFGTSQQTICAVTHPRRISDYRLVDRKVRGTGCESRKSQLWIVEAQALEILLCTLRDSTERVGTLVQSGYNLRNTRPLLEQRSEGRLETVLAARHRPLRSCDHVFTREREQTLRRPNER